MEDSSGEKNRLYKPRPYQLELFEKAIQRDIIIHARTGSGKTFISVMLINHMSNEIEKPYSEGGKRSIFLANTVPLVKQQAEFLRSQTHFEIGDYFGDKRIDNKLLDVWDTKIWQKELENKQILVMTPKIFENMIDHCFIDLEKVNLIIFDECHHGTGKHPYSIIMKKVKEKKKEVDLSLKILGMTASIVNQKCSLDKFNKMMQKLEETYGCKIETSSIILNEEEGIKEQNKPKTMLTMYENTDADYVTFKDDLLEIKKDLESYDEEQEKNRKEKKDNALNGEDKQLIFSSQNDNPYNSIKKECSDVQNVFEELGLWSFCKALKELIARLLSANYSALEPTEKERIEGFIKKFENLFEKVRQIMSEEDEQNVEKIYQFSSDKLKKMLDIFLEQKENNQNFHSIIFVERKYMAYFMDLILRNLNQTETWSFIKSDFISSISGGKKNMTLTQQEKALRSFRKHQINILVATSIVEEGVDVPACNMVIRFSKIYNFGSYIQSKGRARSKNSLFVIMINGNDPDLDSYKEIEEDLEKRIAKENIDEFFFEPDELDKLDLRIKPYIKGNCRITCTKAIDLINRYCSSLENNACGVLYPLYSDETLLNNETKVFRCRLRLPPNSVINKTIQSDVFEKKKWAKMDAALKMCIELDQAGELAENLTILSKEDWLSPHYNLKDHFEEDIKMGKKVGSRKLKREYTTAFADEFIENKVVPNQVSYLYSIFVSEKPEQKKLNKERNFGFLSSKKLPNIPIYKLYNESSEYSVAIVDSGVEITLNKNQYEILKKYFTIILRLLRVKAELNFDDPVYGILLTILKPKKFEIDWEYFASLPNDLNAYEYFNQIKEINPDSIKECLWLYRNQLVSIKQIEYNLSPLSPFPNTKLEFPNFKEYFEKKYALKTLNDNQPLVEVQHESIRNSFIQRGNFAPKNEKKSNYKIFLIMEHLNILPVREELIFNHSMIPAIFYRLSSLLKARKLQLNIEKELRKRLNLESLSNVALSWDDSFKFNRIHQISADEETKIEENLEKIEEITSDSSSDDESLNELLDPMPKYETRVVVCDNQHNSQLWQSEIPNLIIKKQVDEHKFPNMFNILQCVTLKSACDNFDLERYEILGDCFLKLTVVMKIYNDFPNINEGRMVSLKSARVSNNYLYRLAAQKNLNEYIVWDTFNPQKNWIPPNCDKSVFSQNSNYTTKLSDKSMADCIEALIGIYLIQLGTDAAKAFIEWLGFKISDQNGRADLTVEYNLPEPTVAQTNSAKVEELKNKFKKFEESIGYEFKNKFYLLQAFTHPSDINNFFTSSYQKLELVGDAVLDILVTQHIFQDQKEHSPGELTDLRQALVNNKFFAHLSVKHNFYKYFSHLSKDICSQLNFYLQDYKLYPPDAAYLGTDKPEDLKSDDYEIESPKFLADIFESVAGAIYLDSNLNLQTVWEVYFKMLKPYIAAFKKNIPCSPIKALHHLKPQSQIAIKTIEKNDETERTFEAELSIDGEIFCGSGRSKNIAKIIACKKAVIKYSDTKVIFF